MMDFAFKMMDFVFKMMDFVFKMTVSQGSLIAICEGFAEVCKDCRSNLIFKNQNSSVENDDASSHEK